MKCKALIVATAIAFTTGIVAPAYASISCPTGTVPGWLDTSGNPTSCVGDTAGNNPPVETLARFVYHPVPAAHYKYYTVHKGDTLWRIAVRSYGNTPHAGQRYRKIMKLNHLHSTTIRAGQKLRLT